MPSFKTCLASLVTVALTLTPAVSARNSLTDGSLAARAVNNVERSVESPSSDLESRATWAQRAAARRAAAARAARKKHSKSKKGRKGKKTSKTSSTAAQTSDESSSAAASSDSTSVPVQAAAANAAPVAAAAVAAPAVAAAASSDSTPEVSKAVPASDNASPVAYKAAPHRGGRPATSGSSVGSVSSVSSGGSKAISSYNKGSAFMTSALMAAFSSYTCTSDINCQSIQGRPANSFAFCQQVQTTPYPYSACTYRCDAGYAPASDGTCVVQPSTCGAASCTAPTGGYSSCNGATCQANCNEGDAYVASSNSCVTTASDVDNCGAPGNVCPESYNGNGSPYCYAGSCMLACSSGYHAEKVDSTSEPMGCFQ